MSDPASASDGFYQLQLLFFTVHDKLFRIIYLDLSSRRVRRCFEVILQNNPLNGIRQLFRLPEIPVFGCLNTFVLEYYSYFTSFSRFAVIRSISSWIKIAKLFVIDPQNFLGAKQFGHTATPLFLMIIILGY